MILEMLEFRKDGKVVCVCSAEMGSGLTAYIVKCREKFNLDQSVKAYIRRFYRTPSLRVMTFDKYHVANVIELHV